MTTERDVRDFLNELKITMSYGNLLFEDGRGKNSQTLADLEIMPNERNKVLEKLEVEDYCEGPLPETQFGGCEMWVFGRVLKGKEIYIKITIKSDKAMVICISFHIAEHPMVYKFK